jgi:uncharacterized membrane protein YobD (UPF0266 family)
VVQHDGQTATTAVLCLVIAVGLQALGDDDAELWFHRGKTVLMTQLSSDMTIDSVRGFILSSIYMVNAFQPNAAYMIFGTWQTLMR